MIDFSPMKEIIVDPAARTARAEAGLRWLEIEQETQRHGLATTGGTSLLREWRASPWVGDSGGSGAATA